MRLNKPVMNNRNKFGKIHKRYFSVLLIFALLFGVLNIDFDNLGSEGDRNSAIESIISSSGVSTEAVTDEHSGLSFLRGAVVRSSKDGRSFGIKNIFIASIALGLSLFLLFCLYHSDYFKTVIFSRLVIVTYIHDLDGLKS